MSALPIVLAAALAVALAAGYGLRERRVRRQVERLSALARRVLEMVAADRPLPEVLDRLTREVEAVYPDVLASILLLDPDGLHVRHGAAPSLPDAYNEAVDGEPIGPNAGSCGTAAWRREQVIVTDIATDPLWADYRPLALGFGLRACWSTPVLAPDGQVLGTFAIYYREPAAPTDDHQALIAKVTSLAAVAIGRDRAEQTLRDREQRLRNLFEQAADGIFVITPDHHYLEANEAGLAMLGYSLEELHGMRVGDVLTERERYRLDQEVPVMMAGTPHLAEWEHLRKDGTSFSAEVSARPLAGDHYLAIVRDLTTRKAAEQALRESEQRFRQLFDLSPVPLCYVDRDGVLADINERFRRTFGYTHEEIPTLAEWWQLAYPDPEYRRWVVTTWEAAVGKAAAEGRDIEPIEYRVTCKHGDERIIEISGTTLGDNFLATFFDVTERRRAEMEVRQLNVELEDRVAKRTAELEGANQRLKELDQLKSLFIASMSHELRTPLNSVIGFTGLLLMEQFGPLTDKQRDYLQRVADSGKHLLNLITDVIDVSKIEAGKVQPFPETFPLEALVAQAVSTVQAHAEQKGLTIAAAVPSIDIKTDRQRLLQCLLNYLSNAVKYSESGEVHVEAAREDGHLRIEVRDQGVGIAPEQVPRLFQQFSRIDSPLTRRTLGTGLGLYLTRKLATEVLGGEVGVDSEPGAGSCFWLKIPIGDGP